MTIDWQWLWTSADCTWSYYDLRQAIVDDYGDPEFIGVSEFDNHVNFYHAPLGVNAATFYPRHHPDQRYTIATSGVSRLQESVRECIEAAKLTGGSVFHVGDRAPSWRGIAKFSDGMDDNQLATHYSACEFVSGLRRKEGFELPAAEGLLCGARPVLFSTPDYRFNYRDWAEYIEETDRQGVIDQLVALFQRGARPVTPAEIAEARDWFNWERICAGFWDQCLS